PCDCCFRGRIFRRLTGLIITPVTLVTFLILMQIKASGKRFTRVFKGFSASECEPYQALAVLSAAHWYGGGVFTTILPQARSGQRISGRLSRHYLCSAASRPDAPFIDDSDAGPSDAH